MSVTFSSGCGTGAPRICTKGQMSAMCSKKCRSSPTCGPRSTLRQGGREPPWERGASGTPPCGSTRTSLPALSFLCPREEWCLNSDRAIATTHPLVAQERAEASLSPAAGTACAAACIVASSHHNDWWWCVCGEERCGRCVMRACLSIRASSVQLTENGPVPGHWSLHLD